MKLGKRQLILAGLILTLGGAVYLNWQFSSTGDLLEGADAVSVSKELGQAEFVNTTGDKKVSEKNQSTFKSTSKSTEKTTSPSSVRTDTVSKAESPSENTQQKSSDEYFAKAKMNRQQTQDKIAEMAKEMLQSSDQSESVKAEAVAKAAELAAVMEQQTNIESLIQSKGFDECLAFIQNGECSIVVKDNELTSEEAMIIKDIVTGQTGVSAEKIKITAPPPFLQYPKILLGAKSGFLLKFCCNTVKYMVEYL